MARLVFIVVSLLLFLACKNESLHDEYTSESDHLVNELFIKCNIKNFEKIYNNYNQNIYIPVEISCKGKTNSNARMRIRGDSSREFPKKSLKVKLDSGPMILNRKVLNINAEYEDPSYIHQYLSSRLMKESGHVCFTSEHVRLYINGEYYGLYLLVENVDDTFLEKRGLDKNNNLYKAKKDGACLSVFDDLNFNWEKKTNKKSGMDDLHQLIWKLDTFNGDFYEFAQKNFDYKSMVNIIAMNCVLSNLSTYYHNYYMYHYADGRWEMFPWDMDKSFTKYGNTIYHRSTPFWTHDNNFVERAVSHPLILNDIKNRIVGIKNSFFNEEYLAPIIDSLKNVLLSSVENDSTDRIVSVKEWGEQLEKEKDFIKTRPDQLINQINNFPYSFKVKRTPESISRNYIFRWHPSSDPQGREIIYNFVYSKHINLFTGKDIHIINNITDTFLLCPDFDEEGLYYWKITASNKLYNSDGYDNLNSFYYKKGKVLPNIISDQLILNEEGSPYFINEETKVEKGGELNLLPGAEIRFKKGVNLFVYGKIISSGTKENPVWLTPDTGQDYWGYIYIINPDAKCEFNYTVFNEGHLYAKDLDLSIHNSKFNIDKKILVNNGVRFGTVWFYNGNFEFVNSSVKGNGTGEGMNICKAEALVENSLFDNTPDAVEFIEVKNGIIRNNKIINSPDDAIDFNGCYNVLIEKNIIYNNSDKGISIGHEGNGPSKKIRIYQNQIINNNIGIAVKDSSDVEIVNNTLYRNKIGIYCYLKQYTGVGGKATVKNTIISESKELPVKLDEKSKMIISYSLSDTKKIPGDFNIHDGPDFYDPETRNFLLNETSPCINAADPNSELNFIGALPQVQKTVIINEVFFNRKSGSGEWIELYNESETEINISNWIITDAKNKDPFTIPENTILKSKGYLVIYGNKNKSYLNLPENRIQENFSFGINKIQEKLYLYNSRKVCADSVVYNLSGNLYYRLGKDPGGYALKKNIFGKTAWKVVLKKGTPGLENISYGSKIWFGILMVSILFLVFILRLTRKR